MQSPAKTVLGGNNLYLLYVSSMTTDGGCRKYVFLKFCKASQSFIIFHVVAITLSSAFVTGSAIEWAVDIWNW